MRIWQLILFLFQIRIAIEKMNSGALIPRPQSQFSIPLSSEGHSSNSNSNSETLTSLTTFDSDCKEDEESSHVKGDNICWVSLSLYYNKYILLYYFYKSLLVSFCPSKEEPWLMIVIFWLWQSHSGKCLHTLDFMARRSEIRIRSDATNFYEEELTVIWIRYLDLEKVLMGSMD